MLIVPISRLTHIHFTSSARDCDGRYDDDHMITPRDGSSFRELWDYVTSSRAAIDFHERQDVTRDVDASGYPTLEFYAVTDEGYRHEHYVGCDDEECDPRAYRYRDHTAEAMGY